MERATQPGKVWLVGAGPGSADLLTLRAARVLGQVDVWLIDDLVGEEIHQHARPDAVLEYVGKRGGRCSMRQADINERALAHALAGRSVARVKGGDPTLFGRGGEELAYLAAHGIEVEIVNGLTSGMAAAQSLGVGLTHRDFGHGVTFVTAHTADDGGPDWPALCAGGTTLVIYMGMSRLADIRDALCRAGKPADTPAAVVMNASRVDERQWCGSLATLTDALDAGLASPAIILVGGVLAHARHPQPAAFALPLAHATDDSLACC